MSTAPLRPVLTLHLPVPLDLPVEVQRVFLGSYPQLAETPAGQVMDCSETAVVFLAPEALP